MHGGPLPPPGEWGRPGLVLVFNLECAACVSRGIPFLGRLHAEFEEGVQLMTPHTSRGHRLLPREDVEPTVTRCARDFARLPFPVALDVSGDLARTWGTEGTPHRFASAPGGQLVRSVYGSQENARTRLTCLMEELAERKT